MSNGKMLAGLMRFLGSPLKVKTRLFISCVIYLGCLRFIPTIAEPFSNLCEAPLKTGDLLPLLKDYSLQNPHLASAILDPEKILNTPNESLNSEEGVIKQFYEKIWSTLSNDQKQELARSLGSLLEKASAQNTASKNQLRQSRHLQGPFRIIEGHIFGLTDTKLIQRQFKNLFQNSPPGEVIELRSYSTEELLDQAPSKSHDKILATLFSQLKSPYHVEIDPQTQEIIVVYLIQNRKGAQTLMAEVWNSFTGQRVQSHKLLGWATLLGQHSRLFLDDEYFRKKANSLLDKIHWNSFTRELYLLDTVDGTPFPSTPKKRISYELKKGSFEVNAQIEYFSLRLTWMQKLRNFLKPELNSTFETRISSNHEWFYVYLKRSRGMNYLGLPDYIIPIQLLIHLKTKKMHPLPNFDPETILQSPVQWILNDGKVITKINTNNTTHHFIYDYSAPKSHQKKIIPTCHSVVPIGDQYLLCVEPGDLSLNFRVWTHDLKLIKAFQISNLSGIQYIVLLGVTPQRRYLWASLLMGQTLIMDLGEQLQNLDDTP